MTGRLLIFRAGGVTVAVPLEQVTEVLEPPPFFPVPLAPATLGRAITANGMLVPVLDAGTFLGKSASSFGGRVLVMAGEGVNLALQVDRVVDVVRRDEIAEELPSPGEPFSRLLSLPTGEAAVLSVKSLLQMIERRLGGAGGLPA